MKAKTAQNQIAARLSKNYPEQEAGNIAKLLLEHYFGMSRTDWLLDRYLADYDPEKISKALERLKKSEPIQHILGEAWFYGRSFRVSPDTLIPRSETEELVRLIAKRHAGEKPCLLDIGTGSGCIAISLALELPDTSVNALDISPKALETARQNADTLGADINFFLYDILNPSSENLPNDLDIIVSNPPYVCESEKKEMRSNVLDYEPGLALFVKDEDPLLFYRTIAEKARSMFAKHGFLYYEINEAFGHQTSAMLDALGYTAIEIIRDIHGKDRFISAVWNPRP